MASINYFDSGMSNGAKNFNARLRLRVRLKQFMRRKLAVLYFICQIRADNNNRRVLLME